MDQSTKNDNARLSGEASGGQAAHYVIGFCANCGKPNYSDDYLTKGHDCRAEREDTVKPPSDIDNLKRIIIREIKQGNTIAPGFKARIEKRIDEWAEARTQSETVPLDCCMACGLTWSNEVHYPLNPNGHEFTRAARASTGTQKEKKS